METLKRFKEYFMETFKFNSFVYGKYSVRIEKPIILKNKIRILFIHDHVKFEKSKKEFFSSIGINSIYKFKKKKLIEMIDGLEFSFRLIEHRKRFSHDLAFSFLEGRKKIHVIVDVFNIEERYNVFEFGICKESKKLLKKYIHLCTDYKENLLRYYQEDQDSLYIFRPLHERLQKIIRDGYSKYIKKEKDLNHSHDKYVWVPTKDQLWKILEDNFDVNKYQEWRKVGKLSIKCEELNYLGFLLEKGFNLFYDKNAHYFYEVNNFFRINDFISLRLVNGSTMIYIKNKPFRQCKYLVINIPTKKVDDYDMINSIDEAYEMSRANFERENRVINISREEEFWGHCSNLQAWAENDYDTRLLHSNLSFPLLKKLYECRDPVARRRFKEEIILRFESGHVPVMMYLLEENYLKYLNEEERENLKLLCVKWLKENGSYLGGIVD